LTVNKITWPLPMNVRYWGRTGLLVSITLGDQSTGTAPLQEGPSA